MSLPPSPVAITLGLDSLEMLGDGSLGITKVVPEYSSLLSQKFRALGFGDGDFHLNFDIIQKLFSSELGVTG